MMKKNWREFIFLIAASMLIFSCSPTGKSVSKPIAKHVVYIGLDGWGAHDRNEEGMPNVHALLEQGCYTWKKRTVLPSSSAVNWASMFMSAGPELHGYTWWGAKKPDLPSRVILKNNIFPTIFQVYRDQCPDAEIAVLYEWDGIKYLVDTLSLSYHAQSPDKDTQPQLMGDMAVEYIKAKKPNLLALVWNNPDHMGHASGWGSQEYNDILHVIDQQIGRVVDAVREAGMLDETIFIVTSDHGGIGTDHGEITMQEMETPFIITGKGIRKGGEFSESMMQYDVASTIAHIFALETPQVWIGRPMLQVFE